MKIKLYYITYVLVLVSGICLAEGEVMSRSDLLKKFIFDMESIVRDNVIPRPSILFPSKDGRLLPHVPRIEGLDSPDAVPFLIDVIINGPDFSETGVVLSKGYSNHLARCYSVLCLAMIDDPRGHEVVYDIAKGGNKWVTSDLYSADFKEIIYNGPFDPIYLAGAPEDLKRYQQYQAEAEKQSLQRYIVEEHNIRMYATIGLGYIGDQKSFDISMELLNDNNKNVADVAFSNLAEFGDMRVIEPMLEYRTENSNWFYRGMKRLTQVNIKAEYGYDDSRNSVIKYPDYPEVGEIKIQVGSNFAKIVWNQWYNEVKNSSRKKLELAYEKYKNKEKTEPNEGLFYLIDRYGVAALPFLMEKIAAGDEKFINSVTKLTRGKLKTDASKEEVLLWWNKNKEKKTIKL